MSKEKIKAAWNKAKKTTDKVWYAFTAKSKKIVLALSFLALVVVDKLAWDCKIFPEGELLSSNVFKAIIVALLAITTTDFLGIMAAKFGFKKNNPTDIPPEDL